MGLFDKLFYKNPLDDVTVKKYFETICDMYMSLRSTPNRKSRTEDYPLVKKYIEHFMGGIDDEAKLKRAMELYCLSWEEEYNLSKKEKPLLIPTKEFRRQLKEKNVCTCQEEEAYRICYSQVISEIKADYAKVLNIIKDNVNCKHFIEGFKKCIKEKYEKEYGGKLDYFMWIVIKDSFYEDNPITKELVFQFYIDILHNRIENSSESDEADKVDIVFSLALHALHFEKFGNKKDEYLPVAYKECKGLILKSEVYASIIEDHPFDKETYIKKFSNIVKCAYSFDIQYSSFVEKKRTYGTPVMGSVLAWSEYRTAHFSDALANFAWKKIAQNYANVTSERSGENFSESQDAQDVADMFNDYFKKLS